MNFLIVDTANLFHRGARAVQGGTDMRIGMALHVVFNSVKKMWNKYPDSHVVFCTEGRSWRKDHYKPYKENRNRYRESMTVEQKAEEQLIFEALNEFIEYISSKTNCTVLHHPQLEGDDLIAGWVYHHPNDTHVILSSDQDFIQLITDKVSIYNGVDDVVICMSGYYDDKGNKLTDKKTKEVKIVFPEWQLFQKCIRGDTSDNVFSAYPGVRVKGSAKKIGIQQAFSDRVVKGYTWNNFMQHTWLDHDGNIHKVHDDFLRNCMLIDLTKQPDYVKDMIDQTILEVVSNPKRLGGIGFDFLRFCKKHQLNRIMEYSDQFLAPLNRALLYEAT